MANEGDIYEIELRLTRCYGAEHEICFKAHCKGQNRSGKVFNEPKIQGDASVQI